MAAVEEGALEKRKTKKKKKLCVQKKKQYIGLPTEGFPVARSLPAAVLSTFSVRLFPRDENNSCSSFGSTAVVYDLAVECCDGSCCGKELDGVMQETAAPQSAIAITDDNVLNVVSV